MTSWQIDAFILPVLSRPPLESSKPTLDRSLDLKASKMVHPLTSRDEAGPKSSYSLTSTISPFVVCCQPQLSTMSSWSTANDTRFPDFLLASTANEALGAGGRESTPAEDCRAKPLDSMDRRRWLMSKSGGGLGAKELCVPNSRETCWQTIRATSTKHPYQTLKRKTALSTYML